MRFSVLTLFPEFFDSPLKVSLLGRAQEKSLIQVDFLNLREHGEGKYRAVDDKAYGGGPGMVLMPEVVERALNSFLGGVEQVAKLEASVQNPGDFSGAGKIPHIVYLSPQGAPLNQNRAKSLAQKEHIILLCGHYEGIDQRIVDAFVHEEISIGDYILTGGEPAALVLMDAISRFIPGVVGEAESVSKDTFSESEESVPGGLKAPVYTRPALWREKAVPEVLLSGNHGAILKWRKEQSRLRTKQRRPDLLK